MVQDFNLPPVNRAEKRTPKFILGDKVKVVNINGRGDDAKTYLRKTGKVVEIWTEYEREINYRVKFGLLTFGSEYRFRESNLELQRR